MRKRADSFLRPARGRRVVLIRRNECMACRRQGVFLKTYGGLCRECLKKYRRERREFLKSLRSDSEA